MNKFDLINFINTSLYIFIIYLMPMLFCFHSPHPLMILATLIMYTMSTCLVMSSFKPTFFISFILFLMMIGGMIILFSYFTSVIANMKVKPLPNYKFIILTSLSFFLITPILFMTKWSHFNSYNIGNLPWSLNIINPPLFMTLHQIYNSGMFYTIISIIYLLFVLFSVMKICSMMNYPLRKTRQFKSPKTPIKYE